MIQRLARDLFEAAARLQPDAVWATLVNFLPVQSKNDAIDVCSLLPDDLAHTLVSRSTSSSSSSATTSSALSSSSFPESNASVVPIALRSYEDLWRQNLQMQLAITKSSLTSAPPANSISPFERNARWLLSRIDQTCERALPFVLQF
jgi:hypothetical protein